MEKKKTNLKLNQKHPNKPKTKLQKCWNLTFEIIKNRKYLMTSTGQNKDKVNPAEFLGILHSKSTQRSD